MTQRLFPRIRTSVPVSFTAGGAREEGRIENASLRGMRIVSPSAPAFGDVLELDVSLPGGKTARVEARVVSIEPASPGSAPWFAVELTRPNDDWAALIGLLVGANLRKGSFSG